MSPLRQNPVVYRLLYGKRPPVRLKQVQSLLFGRSSAQIRDQLQNGFARYVTRLAKVALRDVDRWEERMKRAVRNHFTAQAIVARRRGLLPSEMLELGRGPLKTQLDYVTNFAKDIRAANRLKRPLKEGYIASRSKLYSGAARGIYYRMNEEGTKAGFVIDYISRDDQGTCSPCLVAEQKGPYLPGEGPYPGEVCLGRGHCRCERRERKSQAAWQRLSKAA